MKKIIDLIKRFLLSFIILYGFNTIASASNIVIPMNIFLEPNTFIPMMTIQMIPIGQLQYM